MATKTTPKKAVSKKAPSSKVATKPARTKKPAVKKATPKKATPKKAAAKKPSVKKPAPKKTASQKPTPKKTPAKKPASKKPTPKKSTTKKPTPIRRSARSFRVNEHVVYPARGVGQIVEIGEAEIGGGKILLFVIHFEKEKLTLRLPVEKAQDQGLRKLADKKMMAGMMRTLKGRARIKRTMWSRRAQEYEAKIHSGNLIALAEVVRDLYRHESQGERSYSEKQLYEFAIDRLTREVALVRKATEADTLIDLEEVLAKTVLKSISAKSSS